MTSNRVAVAYVRKSKGDDLQTQIEDVQLLARQRGLTLAHIYRDESISAAELHGRSAKARPDFNLLMAAVARGEISHVLVRNTDRLIRGRRERVDVYEALARHKVSLLVLKGTDLDLSSASGRLVAGVLAEVAAHEVEAQSERTQRAMRRRLEQGLPPTAGRTFGFTADGMTLVPAEADAVRGAFAYVLAGGSLSGAARQLNDTGLTTRGGKQHTVGKVRHMLKNLRYAAVHEDADGKVRPLVSPSVVPEDTVRAARALLADPTRRKNTSNASRWALSGIGACGPCGGKVTSGSRGRWDDRSERVPIYRCTACWKIARAAQPVDDYLRVLVAAVVQRDADELMVSDGEDPAVQAARDDVELCRRKLSRLAAAFADDDSDDAATAYKDAREAVSGRLRAAQAVLDRSHQDDALAAVVSADDVRTAVDALPLDRFRHVLGVLFQSVTLLPTRHLPKALGFQPSSVAVVLRSGKAVPAVPGEMVTIGPLAPDVAKALADTLRSGGWPVKVLRGGRITVPADVAEVSQQMAGMTQRWGIRFNMDPRTAVLTAALSWAAAAPDLTEEQKAAVRAALA